MLSPAGEFRGVSALVDPFGHVLALTVTPEGSAGTLIADVPLGSGGTLCSRLGDWLGWLSLGGRLFFAVYMRVVTAAAAGRKGSATARTN